MRYLKEESFYQRYKVSPEGLVLWLDQSDGRSYGDLGNWYDMSGEGNHGVQATAGNQPAITGTVGLAGVCRDFDGTDDYIGVMDFVETGDSGQSLSSFVWIKAAAQSGKGFAGHHDGTLGQYAWFLSSDFGADTNKARCLLSDNGVTVRKNYKTNVVVFDNIWHLCGITWDNGVLKIYIDGVEDTSVTKTTDTAMTSIHNSTVNLIFGAQFDNGVFNNGMNCQIDTTQIFSRVLTAAEIQRLSLVDKPRHGGL